MWWRKRFDPPSDVPADVHEARALKDEASRHLAEARAQAPAVARLAERLMERRAFNHFGDEIQITFTPRGGRA